MRLSVFASLRSFIELFIHSGSRLRDERKSRDLLGEVSRTVSTFSAVFQTTIVKLSSALLRNSSVDLKGRIVILLRFTENLGHRTFITPLGSNPLPKSLGVENFVWQLGASDLRAQTELINLAHSWRRLASKSLTLLRAMILHSSLFCDSSGTKASVTVFMIHDRLVEVVWSVLCAQQSGTTSSFLHPSAMHALSALLLLTPQGPAKSAQSAPQEADGYAL